MLPKKDHKYILFMDERMIYRDAQGSPCKKEDHRYVHAHASVREVLCRPPFTSMVTGYEPVGGRAIVYFNKTLDEQVRAELKARTKGIVARIEVNGTVRK